jgi:hypothetical protein
MSLDIGPTDAKLQAYYSFMSYVKKTLFVGSVLLSLEFLSLGFFINLTFAWITQQGSSSLLTAVLPVDSSSVRLDSPDKTGAFVLARLPIDASLRRCLTTAEPAQLFLRSIVIMPFSFRIILTPKFLACQIVLNQFLPFSSAASHFSDENSSAVVILDCFFNERYL